MGGFQRLADLTDDVHSPEKVQRALSEERSQGLPFQELHHAVSPFQALRPALLAHLQHLDDVRMPNAAHRTGLAKEPVEEQTGAEVLAPQQLQRHRAAITLGAEDAAHRALAE